MNCKLRNVAYLAVLTSCIQGLDATVFCDSESRCPENLVCGTGNICVEGTASSPSVRRGDVNTSGVVGDGETEVAEEQPLAPETPLMLEPLGTSEAGTSSEELTAGVNSGMSTVSQLEIVVVRGREAVCSGHKTSFPLELRGGLTQTYQWELEPHSGVEAIIVDDENGVRLDVLAAESGSYSIVVRTLLEGQLAAETILAWEVLPSPQITLQQLPAICPNELYDIPLDGQAQGGNAERYQWSVKTVFESFPRWEQGLTLEGSTLKGRFESPNPRGEEFATISLGLTDGFCEAEPVQLTLRQMPEGAQFCPQIVAEPSDFGHLPLPCLGNEYTLPFRVTQGVAGDYSWRAVQSVPGLGFDESTQVLSGIPEGAGQFVVQVTDNSPLQPRTIEAQFDLNTRDKCWFAYLANTDGPARLNLLDGHLRHQSNARRSFPATATNAPVVDFEFSPQGQFIAYRLRQADETLSLRLVDLRTWRDVPLTEIEGSVAQYAWSVPAPGATDAATLAIAFSTDGEEILLGGISLASRLVDVESEFFYLTPTPTPVDSPLTWFAPDQLAFIAPDLELALLDPEFANLGISVVATALLAADGTFQVTEHQRTFPIPASLVAGEGGVFLRRPKRDPELHFRPGVGGQRLFHAVTAIVSPQGDLVGRAQNDRFVVYRPSTSSGAEDARPLAALEGCTRLLSWAKEENRIACTDSSAGGNRLAFFELLDGTPRRLERQTLSQEEDYSDVLNQTLGRKRGFSANGEWFAFSTELEVYLARVGEGVPRVELLERASTLLTPPTDIAFSPDGQFLVVQAGARLAFWQLEPKSVTRLRTVEVAINVACDEDFLDEKNVWCGNALRGPVQWSAGSDLMAFAAIDGQLQLGKTHLGTELLSQLFEPESSCGERCLNSLRYRFQP